MSFGALGKKAVLALNLGAKLGDFYQNTGEGGLTPYHLENRGDVVMQIGTGYFGCREKKSGKFCEELFIEKSTLAQVKMIEIKISQGAKPAHGGVLPAVKVTKEIAAIRNVEPGVDCISPPSHSAFRTPIEMLEFIVKLRELSGGKPVGFKLCIGIHQEFMNVCKAMLQTGTLPDFITVDGAEGGTGAAPVEFTNNIGVPLNEGLIFVHNCLTGIGVRDKIKIIAAGKVISGFDLAKKLALGADICNSARGMMFSLGCIQSRRCHNNTCPTGIATQDDKLMYGLDVEGKAVRVKNYHHQTLHNFHEVLGAAGLTSPDDLLPQHIWRRLNQSEGVENYAKLYEYLDVGVLLGDDVEWAHAEEWYKASAETFAVLV
jgi:glutamate synthase domain-containing protein 2